MCDGAVQYSAAVNGKVNAWQQSSRRISIRSARGAFVVRLKCRNWCYLWLISTCRYFNYFNEYNHLMGIVKPLVTAVLHVAFK